MSALRSISVAFSPNQPVSRTTMYIIIGVQLAIALVIWFDSPFVVLPTPIEVVRALNTLWFQERLGRELWTSFSMNLQSLALTMLISLARSTWSRPGPADSSRNRKRK